MEENERQVLKGRIKALEDEIIERTRNYLYQHRMNKNHGGTSKITRNQGIQVGSIKLST